jgi:hypothetical protein
MTPYQYVSDARFDPYLVSIAFEDGTVWCDSPTRIDWSSNRLKQVTFVAHNAAFDGLVLLAMKARGMVPKTLDISRWACTADMSVFLGYPRTLAGAAEVLLGRKISKQIRGDMNGKHFVDAVNEGFGDELVKYARDDAVHCLELWMKFNERFPEIERKVSAQNRMVGWHGVKIDVEACAKGQAILSKVLLRAEEKLPWVTEGKPAGSIVELNLYCVQNGVEPPASWNRKDPAFKKWLKENPAMSELVDARLVIAGMGAHINRLKKMQEQVDPDLIMHPSIKYFGSHTGRYSSGRTDDAAASGESKSGPVNLLNLPTHEIHGVNMRSPIIPRPGHKFITADYCQIEPRVNLWLAKDQDALDAIFKAEGRNIYWAVAVKMGWIVETMTLKEFKADTKLYNLTKAVTIALGYGMGTVKFIDTLASYGIVLDPVRKANWPEPDRRVKFMLYNQLGLTLKALDDPDKEQFFEQFFAVDAIVKAWRLANTKILEFHKKLEGCMAMPCDSKLPYFALRLPSGRCRPYFKCKVGVSERSAIDPDTEKMVTRAVKQLHASPTYSSASIPIYGGLLCENIVQSLSRDIMAYSAVAIEQANKNYHYLWSVHDELIFEVPENDVVAAQAFIDATMCSNKYIDSWTKGLPLMVESKVRDCYGK